VWIWRAVSVSACSCTVTGADNSILVQVQGAPSMILRETLSAAAARETKTPLSFLSRPRRPPFYIKSDGLLGSTGPK